MNDTEYIQEIFENNDSNYIKDIDNHKNINFDQYKYKDDCTNVI